MCSSDLRRPVLGDRLLLLGDLERLDRDGHLVGAAVELGHPGVDLFADRKALGALVGTIAGTDLTAFIKRSELARDRSDQRPERFSVGEKVDARIIQFDRRARKVAVSIKALEVAEEKEAIAQYGSADSGASLGDILGAALKARDRGEKAK